MDVEGIENEPVENSNWRLNGIHYDSCDDWLGDGPVVASVKHDLRPHTIFPSWACSRKTEPSCMQLHHSVKLPFCAAAKSSGRITMNHLTHLWVNMHPSPCWTCTMHKSCGWGVCLLLKHRRINTPNFSREITGLLRSLVIAVLSVISFCPGGKHLFIV